MKRYMKEKEGNIKEGWGALQKDKRKIRIAPYNNTLHQRKNK